MQSFQQHTIVYLCFNSIGVVYIFQKDYWIFLEYISSALHDVLKDSTEFGFSTRIFHARILPECKTNKFDFIISLLHNVRNISIQSTVQLSSPAEFFSSHI